LPYTKILVAYDASEPSEKALDQAVMLTRDNYATQLVIVHVYFFPTAVIGEAIIASSPENNILVYNYAQSVVDKATQRVSSIPLATVLLKQGVPAETILEYADETKCDLIIVGNKRHSGIHDFMLGSVSHTIIQHAEVPVLLVK
jgi:nucleotide-binding universal stress UspA family protein